MRKTTSTLTSLVAAGALTAFGLGLAPAVMAAVPSDSVTATSATAAADAGTQQRAREGHGPRGERPGLETIMSVLDLTEDELKAAREAGTTLAELAEQQGVDVADLIDALVADAEERITDYVNGVEPADGERGERGPGGHGPRGPADDADDSDGS